MGGSSQGSGTLTFLITDLADSTQLLERLGDEEATSITSRVIAGLGTIATQHGGEVFKNVGDGAMVVFPSALNAVTCAVAMQRSLAPGSTESERSEVLPVRIGIHAGEPIRTESDYVGMPVNVAVRICHTANGGQVLVSDLVHGLVGSRGGYAFADLGDRTLTGLSSPVRVWELIWEPNARTLEKSLGRAAPKAHRTSAPNRAPDAVVLLFADIVDSIPHTERLGDEGFRERARQLDALLRAVVRENRGTAVEGKLVGDGVLAVFPSARSAITCALRCGSLAASVDLQLHLGIHAGDVIREGNNVYGGAVNIASRISSVTKPGEILLSDTVRGLARTSGGVSFEDRGEYALKGLDEPMRLFTVKTIVP